MTLSISINSDHGSDHFSSDDEGGSGVHVTAPSIGDHGYQDYDEWAHLSYPDELKPSDSASRPRTAHRSRPPHGSRSASGRRPTSRRMLPDHQSFAPRGQRQPSPESQSEGSADEYTPYPRQQDRRGWQQPMPPAYPPSQSSGPTFNQPYPPPPGHAPYPHNVPVTSDLMRIGGGQPNPYGAPPYGYPPQYPHGSPFLPDQGPPHQRHAPRQPQMHNPMQPPMGHAMAPHAHGPGSPYGGYPHEMMAYGQQPGYHPSYFGGPMQGMMPPYWPHYPQISTPPQPEPKSPPPATPAPPPAPTPAPAPEPAPAPPPPPVDTAKDEQIARLEKLILDDRNDREAKELAKRQAIERAAAEKAAQDAQMAHDRKITQEAAALARADAEKKAAEDAAKAKEEAEKATATAASEAAAAATTAAHEAAAKEKKDAEEAAAKAQKEAEEAEAKANEPPPPPPPPEKKKPIKFKDAVGRKFSFPFELCATWRGMEELIRQAFLHIEVIGPHVAEGHYDLVGPNGDIILPQVWETVIEPDWAITMHMWPIPEKPKEDPAPEPAPEKPADPPAEPKKKADGPKKPKAKGPEAPGSFAMWMLGGTNRRGGKGGLKVEKKPEAPAPAPAP